MSKQKETFIPIEKVSKPGAEPRLVSYEEFQKHRKLLDWTFGFLVAVVIICFTSFVAFIVDAWRFHSETLRQNTHTLETLKQENQDLRFVELQRQFQELEKSVASQQKKPETLPSSLRRPTQNR